ncbi:MAG: magnesium transporter [Planctomycetota bacterium]|jgi:magnesium transporter
MPTQKPTDRPPGPDEAAAVHAESHIEDVGELSPRDERVAELIEHTIDVPVLASAVQEQEAADAADTLETLAEQEAAEVLEQMDDRSAAEALAEMEAPLAAGLMQDLVEEELSYAARLLEQMAPDDAADLLQALDDSYREEALAGMRLDAAAELRKLISYDRESAGGLMTTDYLALDQGMTVAEATESIRAQTIPEGVQHLLVAGDDGRLVGVIGLRDLLLGRANQSIAELMKASVKAVRPNVDREQVAREFDRYDYAMLPVVDLDERLIGIVTVDDVIDIIRAEQTEDVQKTVGAGAVEAVYSRLGEKFRGRFPWLGASLVMTGLAAVAVLLFEDLIRALPVLAFLMPVIAALVGNAGHQALAVTLRGIVLDEVRRDRVWPLVLREGTVGLLNGAALGAVLFVGVGLLGPAVQGATWSLGLVAGLSTMIAMVVGTLAGSAIPLIMRRLGIDPAQSSAIVLIMLTDGVAFTTLLSLSFSLLTQLPAA